MLNGACPALFGLLLFDGHFVLQGAIGHRSRCIRVRNGVWVVLDFVGDWIALCLHREGHPRRLYSRICIVIVANLKRVPVPHS